MAVKIAISVGSVAAAGVAVTLLDACDAAPQLAVAILALIAMTTGVAIALFWEVPDEPPKWTRSPGRIPPRP
jgi:hypothetical protein